MIEHTIHADTGLFYCPLSSEVHAKVDDVSRRSFEWMNQFGLWPTERQRKRLMATNSSEFYGRITPAGLEDRLQIAADWCYWGFAFDDVWSYEGEAAERSEEFTALVARLVRLLETLDERLCEGDRYLTALYDIAVRFARCATQVQMRRFIEAHRLWLFGIVQRHSFQARRTIPSVDAYLTMRLHDCGGAPCTAMIDIVNGLEVLGDEMDAPEIRALTEVTWMVAAIDNERVSRAKEIQGEGDAYNLVDVVMYHRRCSPEQALREVVALRDRMMCLFLRLHAQAMSGAGSALRRYLEDLAHLIPGNIVWSLKTARYAVVYGSGSAEIGAVALSGGWAPEPADARIDPPPVPSLAWWWQQIAAN